MIGQIVNYRYEVLEKVGDGELFSVYKSRDKVLNRLVALKILNKELSSVAAFASAVREGYQGVTGLDHPNIARTFEADSADGEQFVACEYVRGTNVKERVRKAGPVSVSLALDIAIPVLEALEYAHANGIVHGDIRPQDIIVSPDGEVELTDFGLSHALSSCPEVAGRYAMRSVHYAAPEIAEGAPASASSDLYAIGVVLYEMLTGALPFAGATAVAVALKQAKELPTPPRTINTSVPKSLSDFVMRAIEKSPADRFRSASEMLADLRSMRDALRIGKPLSIPQPAVTAPPREAQPVGGGGAEPSLVRPYLWLILVFVVVVLVSMGAVMLSQGQHGKVELPMLLDKSYSEARYEAEQAGLTLVQGEEVFSDSIEEGKVCAIYQETDRKGGTDVRTLQPGDLVDRNSVISARISKGPSWKPVPDLTGLPESDAYRAAEDEGFKVGKSTGEYDEKVPAQSVIRQTPAAGVKRAPGSSITIVVSIGPKPSTGTEPSEPSTKGEERKFNVAVEVPSDADGAQEVRIVVEDSRGETVAYQRDHEPGDKFTQPIVTYGSSAHIMVYVGGELASDDTY